MLEGFSSFFVQFDDFYKWSASNFAYPFRHYIRDWRYGIWNTKKFSFKCPGYIIRLIEHQFMEDPEVQLVDILSKTHIFHEQKTWIRYLLFYKIIVQNKTFSSSLLKEYTIYNSTYIYGREKIFFSYLVIKNLIPPLFLPFLNIQMLFDLSTLI